MKGPKTLRLNEPQTLRHIALRLEGWAANGTESQIAWQVEQEMAANVDDAKCLVEELLAWANELTAIADLLESRWERLRTFTDNGSHYIE